MLTLTMNLISALVVVCGLSGVHAAALLPHHRPPSHYFHGLADFMHLIHQPKQLMHVQSDEKEQASSVYPVTPDPFEISMPAPDLAISTPTTETADMHDLDEFQVLMTWFVEHDLDADGYLDGSELLHAFSQNDKRSNMNFVMMPTATDRTQAWTAIRQMVDHVMGEDDSDMDGRISIREFLRSHNH